jgi:hypothetical protein
LQKANPYLVTWLWIFYASNMLIAWFEIILLQFDGEAPKLVKKPIGSNKAEKLFHIFILPVNVSFTLLGIAPLLLINSVHNISSLSIY